MYIYTCVYIYILYTQYHTPTTPPGARGTVLWLADPWPWRGGRGRRVGTLDHIYFQMVCQKHPETMSE